MEQRIVNRRYRIDRRVGEGRTAVVYLGHDLLLDRPVAVKALRPEFAADRAARERFGRDAAAGAGFSHPNLVATIDLGQDVGTPFVVMDYVAAETLHDVIANEGPFGPDDVAGLLEQVASALDHLHRRGIVHRNLTPANVLIEPTGVAKLINVGHSRWPPEQDLLHVDGLALFAHYMSPEEANGLNPTPSSDIYSLGIIAYSLLTGSVPFVAESTALLATQHIHHPPQPPSQRFGGVPLSIDGVVSRALDKNPSRRFPSAGTFAQAMLAWNDQSSDDVSSPSNYDNGVAAEIEDAGQPVTGMLGLRRRMSRLVGLSLVAAACGGLFEAMM